MKRKDVGTARIERVDFPNEGRFQVPESGERGIVKNVMPGQTVSFRVYKKKKGVVYGNRLQVLEKSPLETREPFCGIFGQCGGCLYQTMPYEEQLRMKEEQIRRLLSPVISGDTVYDGIKASPRETGYRNKMDLSFGNEVIDGPLTLGMHRLGARYTVLDADTCRLVHPDLIAVQKAVRDFFREREVPFYNKLSHVGFLRYLLLRRSETTGEILLVLASSSQMQYDFGPFVNMLLDIPLEGSFAGIMHAVCDRYADALLPDELVLLHGRDYFYEELSGLMFKVTAFSFFQTNTLGAEVLYSTAKQYVGLSLKGEGEKPVLFDLYCGTGTIAQILAGEAKKVYGIELVEEAVEAARKNSAMNGLTNCEFLAGDVFESLPLIPEKPDFVLVDPPREGVHEKALKRITDYGITDMVYISCKATSFLEDMRCLKARGWGIRRYALVDMFPETQHIEVVSLLSKIQP